MGGQCNVRRAGHKPAWLVFSRRSTIQCHVFPPSLPLFATSQLDLQAPVSGVHDAKSGSAVMSTSQDQSAQAQCQSSNTSIRGTRHLQPPGHARCVPPDVEKQSATLPRIEPPETPQNHSPVQAVSGGTMDGAGPSRAAGGAQQSQQERDQSGSPHQLTAESLAIQREQQQQLSTPVRDSSTWSLSDHSHFSTGLSVSADSLVYILVEAWQYLP